MTSSARRDFAKPTGLHVAGLTCFVAGLTCRKTCFVCRGRAARPPAQITASHAKVTAYEGGYTALPDDFIRTQECGDVHVGGAGMLVHHVHAQLHAAQIVRIRYGEHSLAEVRLRAQPQRAQCCGSLSGAQCGGVGPQTVDPAGRQGRGSAMFSMSWFAAPPTAS